MDKLNLKLDLVMAGYTPDNVGLFTSMLNQQIKISESKVREILGLPLDPIEEAIASLDELDTTERRVFKVAANKLDSVFVDPDSPPDIQTTIKVLGNAALSVRMRVDPARLADLAEFIIKNWNEMKMMNPSASADQMLGQAPSEDPDAAFDQLGRVPQIRKTQAQL